MTTGPLRIGDVVCEPGKRVDGWLELGETPAGPISMPVVLIRGASDGPTLCLTAGVHAAEYPAIDAVLRILEELDPAQLRGSVVAVPVANVPMFVNRAGFLSPIDGLNLNRTAPGHASGSITERIAHTLLTEVIGKADVHIDCHGGDLGEILWPYAGFALTGDERMDSLGESLVRVYSPRIIALYGEGSNLPPTGGSMTYGAVRRGVVSILAECGSNGGLEEEDVRVHMDGIRNVLRHLGMVPGTAQRRQDMLRATGQFIVRAERGGLLRLAIGIGDAIAAGQEVATVVDVFGRVVERVVSAQAGIARLIWATKVVNTGDPIVKCWVTEPAGPQSEARDA